MTMTVNDNANAETASFQPESRRVFKGRRFAPADAIRSTAP